MIKKIYILLLTVLGMGVISSCSDYLNSEKYFKDRLTLEKTFESKDHVEEWLAYAFSFIKNEITNEFGATRLLFWYLGLKCSVFQMGKKIF